MALHWDLTRIEDNEEVCWRTAPCEVCGGTGELWRMEEPAPERGEGAVSVRWVKEHNLIGQHEVCYGCKDEQDPSAIQTMHPILHGLIWGSLAVCLTDLTNDNLGEWEYRLLALAQVGSALFTRYDPEGKKAIPYTPTLEDMRPFVGLRTNVSRQARSAWMKQQIVGRIENKVGREIVNRQGQARAQKLVQG